MLTSGGDCPGLNAVIRAVVRCATIESNAEVIGFRDAWRGALEDDWEVLTVDRCRGVLPEAGTILGTSRVQPYQFPTGVERVKAAMSALQLDGVVVIGGEGSLAAANRLNADGVPCVGVPKTIDNDVAETDVTFGFDTAASVATEAVDRLHATSEAHERVMVLEVMGRSAGHIAFRAGIAGGASAILIPEIPFQIDHLVDAILRRRAKGRYGTVVVVAEGAVPVEGTLALPPTTQDGFGHVRLGGVSDVIATALEAASGVECRTTILGYTQRGAAPTSFDRSLSTHFGVAAARLATSGKWGRMVALQGGDIVDVPLDQVGGRTKLVDVERFTAIAPLFAS